MRSCKFISYWCYCWGLSLWIGAIDGFE